MGNSHFSGGCREGSESDLVDFLLTILSVSSGRSK